MNPLLVLVQVASGAAADANLGIRLTEPGRQANQPGVPVDCFPRAGCLCDKMEFGPCALGVRAECMSFYIPTRCDLEARGREKRGKQGTWLSFVPNHSLQAQRGS